MWTAFLASRLLRAALSLGILLLATLPPGHAAAQHAAPTAPAPRLVIRSDDMGFSHAANVANEKLIASGLVVNISVLFAAPWYQEAVAILKQHPEVSVGVHLCANAEWKHYKWGPVAGRSQVPSLVDDEGYFFGSYRELNVEHAPRVEEMETEFRAQIERALRSGLSIDYVDNHMGAGMHTEAQRAMVERLAQSYGLAISRYYGEQRPGNFSGGDYAEQQQRLVALVDSLAPDSLYLLVFHVGTDTPELQAMQDLNEGGVRNMSAQRQMELDMLRAPAFREALERNQVQLVSYRELVRTDGPANGQNGPVPADR